MDGQQAFAFEYAFAEWKFSNLASLRIGRVKQPFGLYTEVFDVGTIRPFFMLPQGIYSPQGMVAESYNGVGISGSRYADSGWGVQYDVYGGKLDLEVVHPWEALESGQTTEADGELDSVNDVLGGRLILATPVLGLSVGSSAYFGTPPTSDHAAGVARPKHVAYGFQAEYLTDVWSVRSEFARHAEGDELTIDGAYLEAAYYLTEQWQLATRYDWSDVTLGELDVSAASTLLEHKEMAFGLNYWVNTNFVIKLAYHLVDGNRFALPADLLEAIAEGSLNTKTNLIQVGTNFSF